MQTGDNIKEERRRDERVPLPLEVAWESVSGNYKSRISDISLTGCYIESIGQVTVGEQIRFHIDMPTGRWLPLSGVVVYQHPQIGFGVRFTNVSERDKSLIAELIDYARSG